MTDKIKSDFAEQEIVRYYDCDCKGRMRLSSILKRSAEIAGHDYTNKGYGHEFLWKNKMVFLLSRVTVRIHKYPKEQQIITNTTWESGKKGAMFIRGTDMTDDNGEVMISLNSGWILANPVSRKIYRPTFYDFNLPIDPNRHINALPLEKIRYNDPLYIEDRVVKICDIDENGHVYNARYSDFAQDIMSMEEFSHELLDFRINYVSEAKLGESISLYKEDHNKSCVIIGKVGDRVCFETEFLFK